MKIGLFADPHYGKEEVSVTTRHPRLSYEKLGEAMEVFQEEKVDLIINLGDLIDGEISAAATRDVLSHISVLLNSSGVETLSIMGNHDAFSVDRYRFGVLTKTPLAPLHRKYGDIDIILLDANTHRDGRPYQVGEDDWTDTMVPEDQVAWLKRELEQCGEKTYVFSHQLIDYNMNQDHVIENAEDICAILSASGKVKEVYQGHYHQGGEHHIGHIPYRTLKAMCEGYDNSFLIIEV